jgi:Asp-tRNA(Asn)/Glu-tRNA(Gln) amidotransferase A subunit family amidase
MTLSWSLDKAGPICRSAEDVAIVFSFIRGTDELDGIPAPISFKYNPASDLKKLKIGYAKNYFDRMDTARNEWKVLDAFRKMGIEPQPMVFPDDSTTWPFDIMGMIIGAECAAAFDAFTRSGLDDEMTRQNRGDWPNSFRT